MDGVHVRAEVTVRGSTALAEERAASRPAEAEELFEAACAGAPERLHAAIVADAEGADGPDGLDYLGGDTYATVSASGGDVGPRELEVGPDEVFERFGRTGGAWKVEVVAVDAQGGPARRPRLVLRLPRRRLEGARPRGALALRPRGGRHAGRGRGRALRGRLRRGRRRRGRRHGRGGHARARRARRGIGGRTCG